MSLKTLVEGREVDIVPSFVVDEGSANLYYGRIRSGKTYGATADIIEEVKRGTLVYATWPIALECFDDRFDFFVSFRNFLFFNSIYYKINTPENFHFVNAETGEVDGIPTFDATDPKAFVKYLNTLNHCKIFIDEAWRVIDSYKGTSVGVEERNLILVTGHKYREVNLIAQRPTSVHVSARGNMGRFYKFEKISSWPWVRFMRTEYQDMVGETVDESEESIVSKKTYWARSKVFNAYNSYFYGDLQPVHQVEFEAFELNFLARCLVLLRNIALPFVAFWRKR